MEADWYVDPLERFEGRYFDGESWTAKVSADGKLLIDSDWPPAAETVERAEQADSAPVDSAPVDAAPVDVDPVAADSVDSPPVDVDPVAADSVDSPPVDAGPGDAGPVDVDPGDAVPVDADLSYSAVANQASALTSSDANQSSSSSDGVDAPAVEPIGRRSALRASTVEESPARPVAVLDDSVASLRGANQADNQSSALSKNRRWLVLAALAIAAALVIFLVVSSLGGDDSANEDPNSASLAERAQSDDELPENLEDLEVDAPTGLVDPGTQFDPAEAIIVGDSQIVNGEPLLAELGDWHEEFAAERSIGLDAQSACWFGRLGDAVVPNVHCGPVGGTADTEYLFDLVPIAFDTTDGEGLIAQPVVDAAVPDAVLANNVELIGSATGPAAPENPNSRGNRTTEDSETDSEDPDAG